MSFWKKVVDFWTGTERNQLRLHKNHVLSLRNKIEKLKFEIDELLPSLRFHENALLETVKKQADEHLNTEEKQITGDKK